MTLPTVTFALTSTGQAEQGPRWDLDTDYHTVAFDRDLMRQLIKVGRLRTTAFGEIVLDEFKQPIVDFWPAIELGLWWPLVPELYQAAVFRGIEAIVFEHRGRRLDPHALHTLIDDLRRWIATNVEPISPSPTSGRKSTPTLINV